MAETEPIDFDVAPYGGVKGWVEAHSPFLLAFPHGCEPPPGIGMVEMNQLRQCERDTVLGCLMASTRDLAVAMEVAVILGYEDDEIEALIAEWPEIAEGREIADSRGEDAAS